MLYPVLLEELKKRSLDSLFSEIEIPLAFVLFGMELNGVKLDDNHLNDLSKDCDKRIEGLEL